MENQNFKDGDRVQLVITKMVSHPDGLTDRLGEVLPVLRNVKVKATVGHGGDNTRILIKVDGRPYEQFVPIEDLTLINDDLTDVKPGADNTQWVHGRILKNA
jgi:hypothetical protein